jgi:TPR repeat protein
LTLASDQGSGGAFFTLSEAYRDGTGVPRDSERAQKYAEAAELAGYQGGVSVEDLSRDK